MTKNQYLAINIVLFIIAIFILFQEYENSLDKEIWKDIKVKKTNVTLKLPYKKLSYAIIKNKNVFHPSRSFGDKKTIQNTKTQTYYKLLGIFIFGEKRYVTLGEKNQKEDEGKEYFLGDEIEGSNYKVGQITSKKVVLIHSTSEKEVVLTME